MSIYLVRWPDLTASLVRADNEDDLTILLEQVDDPSGCKWVEYEGPLFFDFQLAVQIEVEDPNAGNSRTARPIKPGHIHLQGIERLANYGVTPLTITAVSETGYDMLREIMQFALPVTAAVYWDADREFDCESLEEAIREDAVRMLQESWRQGHRRDDMTPAEEAQEAIAAFEQFGGLMMEINTEPASVTTSDNGRGPIARDAEMLAVLDLARSAWIEDRDPGTARRALLLALSLLEGVRPAKA